MVADAAAVAEAAAVAKAESNDAESIECPTDNSCTQSVSNSEDYVGVAFRD